MRIARKFENGQEITNSLREKELSQPLTIETDHLPLDLGGERGHRGMHVSSAYSRRQALGLDSPGELVKVIDPHQMLEKIDLDLADALGVDVVGHKNTTWKTFVHSCGSIRFFLEDFLDAGFNILDPVQAGVPVANLLALSETVRES